MSDSAAPVGRPMKYPYTYTAKLAQFPYAYYFKNQWIHRYYCYAIVLCFPVFWKIQKLSYSPANVANYEAAKKKEAAEHHH